jgi:hypothetical protein
VLVAPVTVNAASIPILNPSFETPTAPLQSNPVDFFTFNDISNWTLDSPDQGVFNPSASQANNGLDFYYAQPVPDGVQVAYSNGGTIFQQLSAVVEANTRYQLNVWVGQRRNISFPGYNLELLAGNTVLASNNSVIPIPGTFALVDVIYNSDAGNSFIGQALGIRLTSLGEQTNFDNVTLDAVPLSGQSVPEPSAILGLLCLGLLGVVSRLP